MQFLRENYHTASFICSHVFDDTHPILLVCKDDGEFQFLCGGIHEGELPRIVGLGHMIDRDRSLLELLNMDDGYAAERESVGEVWQIYKNDTE